MIIGIGSDIVDIRRIERLLQRFHPRFIERTFTAEEQELANSRKDGHLRNATYARRFAAKEACAKALGTGIRGGILFTDIAVINDALGKPAIRLYGDAYNRLQLLLPEGKEGKIHLSLSDEPPYAMAYVIIEAI